jgi:predicted O-linked N-acetylglucosamine transferase (SPINDLY family)
MFEVWMRLLRDTPASVLWLRKMGARVETNLRQRARELGVDGGRLLFAPHMPSMADHLGRQSLADLYLDTLPYNAHSTASDALWTGVPVLTCAGRGFASRVAASALAAVGLPELVTHSLEEYARRALELARDPHRIHALRSKLAQRERSMLFDSGRYTASLETAYLRMHERVARGEPAAAFSIDSALPEA